jgi:hypothetical protein
MRIPDDVRNTVAFVAIRMADESVRFVGTAFVIARAPLPGMSQTFAFTVTARHVIDGVRSKGLDRVHLRVNWTDGGSRWWETPIDSWHFHPTDPSVDVAVFRGAPVPEADIRTIPVAGFVTHDVVRDNEIGIGDEVAIVGLFANRTGMSRNIPIARVGNIAALPEEPIATKLGPTPAYLIEARSIGGLSGSPVFAHLGTSRVIGGSLRLAQSPVMPLLGLIHGHYDESSTDEVASSSRSNVNMGVAVVTPAERILEIINQDAILSLEREAIQHLSPPAG